MEKCFLTVTRALRLQRNEINLMVHLEHYGLNQKALRRNVFDAKFVRKQECIPVGCVPSAVPS